MWLSEEPTTLAEFQAHTLHCHHSELIAGSLYCTRLSILLEEGRPTPMTTTKLAKGPITLYFSQYLKC